MFERPLLAGSDLGRAELAGSRCSVVSKEGPFPNLACTCHPLLGPARLSVERGFLAHRGWQLCDRVGSSHLGRELLQEANPPIRTVGD